MPASAQTLETAQVARNSDATETIENIVEAVRGQFPYLNTNGAPPVFLDSAASAQKTEAALQAMDQLARHHYANVHRGAYRLSAEATDAYEGARRKVARFMDAESPDEIIFVRGVTEAINLVAHSFGNQLSPGDEIIVTELEHHANLVPWHLLAERRGIVLRPLRIDPQARLRLDALDALFSKRTRLLAVTQASNAFGGITPLRKITAAARKRGVPVLVDGAQGAVHLPLSVRNLDADFYAFSGHKLYGPTAIGVLWVRAEQMERMPPWQGGGEMISEVRLESSRYRTGPPRFEAGTPAILEAVGLGAVCDWLETIPLARLRDFGHELLLDAHERLAAVKGIRIYGPPPHEKVPLIAFNLDGVHPHDLATVLDQEGIALRTGHHCAQPALKALSLTATARASFGLYNRRDEVEQLHRAVESAAKFFTR